MKNVMLKTLTVSAAALLATGCVSTSTFEDYVAKNDAAVAAAAQSAADEKRALRIMFVVVLDHRQLAARDGCNFLGEFAPGRAVQCRFVAQAYQPGNLACFKVNRGRCHESPPCCAVPANRRHILLLKQSCCNAGVKAICARLSTGRGGGR